MTARTALVLSAPEVIKGDVLLTTPTFSWVNGEVLVAPYRKSLMWAVATDAGTLDLAPATWVQVLR